MAPATLAPAPAQNAPKDGAPALLVPFVRAAQEHVEAFHDTSTPLGAGTVALSPIDVPAYGFMRGIFIEVTATGGVGGAANVAAKGDAPFSVLSDISLSDVNGQPIVGPLGGYDLFLVNKFGGYRRATTNPKLHPDYSGVASGAGASGNFTFLLYLPIEVSGRDGLGALANLNAASSYKLRMSVAPSADVYATAPATTLPTIRVRAWLDAWTQPAQTDLRGHAQATQPPAHGSTSFWSKKIVNVSAGQQTIRLDRVGNLVRNLVFVFRDAAGVRNKASFPGTFDLTWDTRLLKSLSPGVWRGQMSQRYNLTGADDTAAGLDTGVYVEDYCHEFDGLAGAEMRDGWLPTVQSTRLEVLGNFGAAGTLTILTNDVSPAGEVFV